MKLHFFKCDINVIFLMSKTSVYVIAHKLDEHSKPNLIRSQDAEQSIWTLTHCLWFLALHCSTLDFKCYRKITDFKLLWIMTTSLSN